MRVQGSARPPSAGFSFQNADILAKQDRIALYSATDESGHFRREEGAAWNFAISAGRACAFRWSASAATTSAGASSWSRRARWWTRRSISASPYFDTADMYGDGQSEEMLGKILGARRKDVVLATKF